MTAPSRKPAGRTALSRTFISLAHLCMVRIRFTPGSNVRLCDIALRGDMRDTVARRDGPWRTWLERKPIHRAGLLECDSARTRRTLARTFRVVALIARKSRYEPHYVILRVCPGSRGRRDRLLGQSLCRVDILRADGIKASS